MGKRVFGFLLMLLLISGSAFAGDGDLLVSGNIGAGTTTPNDKVTVDGAVSIKALDSSPAATSGYGKLYVKPKQDVNTKLLLHTDSSFSDSSVSNRQVTAVGNAQISTEQRRFGGASVAFDGSGDYLSIADSDDWDFGGGDFTIDFYAYLRDYRAYAGVIGQTDQWFFTFNNGVPYFWTSNAFFPSSPGDINFGGTVLELGRWHHVALVRYNGTLSVYVNGVARSGANTFNYWHNVTSNLQIGSIRPVDSPARDFNGFIDELRIVKGRAIWTSNFDPPTAPPSATGTAMGLYFISGNGEEKEVVLQ